MIKRKEERLLGKPPAYGYFDGSATYKKEGKAMKRDRTQKSIIRTRLNRLMLKQLEENNDI